MTVITTVLQTVAVSFFVGVLGRLLEYGFTWLSAMLQRLFS